jgi:hypothetical protein
LRLTRRLALALLLVGLTSRTAAAQRLCQLRGNVTFDWMRRDRLTLGLDLEPTALVAPADSPDCRNLDLTPRVGVRFHILSRDLPTIVRKDPVTGRERPPKRRLVVRDWARLEGRNFLYRGETPNSSRWRFGNRLEFLFPLNRANITMDGTRYVLADWQWMVPRAFDKLSAFVPAQVVVGQFLQTFKEYPPSQTSESFGVDQVLQALQGAAGTNK